MNFNFKKSRPFLTRDCVCTIPSQTELQALRLTFDSIENANSLVGDASNVADWNTFFDLPTYGNPFTSVTIVGNTVQLFGGSGIDLKDSLFGNSGYGPSLLEVNDESGCVISAGYDVFGNDNGDGCLNLIFVYLPECITLGYYCFGGATSLEIANIPKLQTLNGNVFQECSSILSVNFPLLVAVSNAEFPYCNSLTSVNLPILTYVSSNFFTYCTSLATINLPSCTDLGGTVGSNNVFDSITGNTITLTIPAALITNNGGNPDGDIQYLQANNTVTVITV